jgi:hypothetical protein
MSTQIAQATAYGEALQRLNQGADEVEPYSSSAADRLRAIATQLGGGAGLYPALSVSKVTNLNSPPSIPYLFSFSSLTFF